MTVRVTAAPSMIAVRVHRLFVIYSDISTSQCILTTVYENVSILEKGRPGVLISTANKTFPLIPRYDTSRFVK